MSAAGAGLVPVPARLAAITPESADTRTFAVRPDVPMPALDAAVPGQFVMLSVFGHGEAAFTLSALAGAGADAGTAVVTVRRVGSLTAALFALSPGARVGLRGPFGRGFAVPADVPLVYVAGGCGLAPLRAGIARHVARDRRGLAVVYGARDADARILRADLDAWSRAPGVHVLECVERPSPGWRGRAGTVLDLVDEAVARVGARWAAVCGPPVMLSAVGERLCRLGLDPADVHLAIERSMKCGTGLCGHCYVGHRYVCTDGPVFSLAQLRALPDAGIVPGWHGEGAHC
jgi:NAD(P)H-flavin reductase